MTGLIRVGANEIFGHNVLIAFALSGGCCL